MNDEVLSRGDADACLASILQRLAVSTDDLAAWEGLYDTTWSFVYASCFRLVRGQGQVAEDLAQEVFLRLARYCSFSRLTDPRRFRAYLWKICYHTALSYLHTAARRAEVSFEELSPETLANLSGDSELEQWIAADEALREALSRLSSQDQALTRLVMRGETLSEIATQLKISYSNAGVRVLRLRRKLRRELDRAGVKVPGLLRSI
jgi:RNA polymerase sigma factor (sigma-70 family)